jgi:hypothetical protein
MNAVSGPQQVRVGAFGKHPAWEDHTEDLGTFTPALARLKKVLYEDGIRGCIDAGAWGVPGEPAPEWLVEYGHHFVFRVSSNELVVGLLWPSRDGRGRDRYPMIVAAHATNLSARRVFERLLPRLERARELISGATTREGVKESVASVQADLDRMLPALGSSSDDPPPGPSAAAYCRTGALSNPPVALPRVFYEMQQEWSAYLSGARPPRSGPVTAHHLRAPAEREAVPALTGWAALLDARLRAGVPWMLLKPVDSPYIDAIVGEATADQFLCIRSGPRRMPLASDVPYELPPGFDRECRRALEAMESGLPPGNGKPAPGSAGAGVAVPKAAASEPEPEERPAGVRPPGGSRTASYEDAEEPDVAARKRLRRVGMLIVVGLIAGAAALILHFNSGPKKTPPPPPPPAPPPAHATATDAPPAVPPDQVQPERAPDQVSTPKAPAEPPAPPPPLPEPSTPAAGPGMPSVPVATPTTPSGPDDPAARERWATLRAAVFQTRAAQDAWAAELRDAVRGTIDTIALDRLDRLRAQVERVEAQIAPAEVGPLPSPLDAQALQRLLRDQRERDVGEALRRVALLEPGSPEAQRQIAALAGESRRDSEQVVSAVRLAVELAEAVQRGRAWTERGPADQPPPSVLWDSLTSHPRFASVSPALGALTDRCRRLVQLAGARDPGQIRGLLEAPPSGSVAEARTAWRAVSALDWPTRPEQYREAVGLVALCERLGLDQADRARAAGWLRARWVALAGGAAPGEVGRVLDELMPQQPDGLRDLPPHLAANMQRWALGRSLRGALADDAAARRGTSALIEHLTSSGAGAEGPALAAALSAAIAEDAPAVFDPTGEGPALGGGRYIGPGSEPEALVYAWPATGPIRVRLEFLTVPVGPGQRIYMARDEVSVGLFAVALGLLDAPDVVTPLMPPDAGERAWPGPRSWRVERVDDAPKWATFAPGRARAGDPMRGWLGSDADYLGEFPIYAPGLTIEPPSERSPMQWLSPEAAMVAAAALGCRLPTEAEWLAARALEMDAGGRDEAWHLRGRAYARQWEHLESLVARNPSRPGLRADLPWPNAGVFNPGPKEADPSAAGDSPETVLWFQNVDAAKGKRFRHLHGNVAEFVLVGAAPANADRPAAGALVMAGKVGVIGGSALSPPSLPRDRAILVPTGLARQGGFSDVGFRVCFSPRDQRDTRPIAQRVLEVLEKTPWFAGPSGR